MELILPSILATCSIFLVTFGFLRMRQRSDINDRISTYLAGSSLRPVTLQEIEMSRPFIDRVLLPLMRKFVWIISRLWPENRLRMQQQRLLLAGSPGRLSAAAFASLSTVSGGACGAIGLFFAYATRYPVSLISLLMFVVLILCGFSLPNFWLSRRITRRQADIVNSLPDALDLLTITSEAGLSFENGLQEIMNKWDNDLSHEFARVLRDIGMGQTRRKALIGLADRTGVPDIQTFVAALNQAEELGVSIGRVLKTQSEEMRIKRRQRAYERANQAPVKIMFPLVFLIFPSIFCVLLGPAIPQLLAFGG